MPAVCLITKSASKRIRKMVCQVRWCIWVSFGRVFTVDCVSGYQSEPEDNISEMANEIVMKVVEEDRSVMERDGEHRTYPRETAKPQSDASHPPVIHRAWQSDHIEHTTEDAVVQRMVKKSKSVRFSVSPPPNTPLSSSLPSTPLVSSPPSPRASALPLPPAPAVAAAVSGGDTETSKPKEKHTTLQWKQVVPSTSKARILATQFLCSSVLTKDFVTV